MAMIIGGKTNKNG